MPIVAIRSTKHGALEDVVRSAMDACGWTDVVKPGARVVIKPNLVSLDPERVEAANTSMELLAAVIRILQTRTPNITVGESDMINPPRTCPAEDAFELNGLYDLARELKFELVNFSRRPTRRADSPRFDGFELPAEILDADVFISMPVLKTHVQGYFTGAIKNMWGCVPRVDRFFMHRHLHECLAELPRLLRPHFAIMDAIVAMEGMGPSYGDPRRLDLVLASRDVVALDATAMRLVGLDVARARHIPLAAATGFGTMDQSAIEVDGDFEAHRTVFKPAKYDLRALVLDRLSPYHWFTWGVLLNPPLFRPISKVTRTIRRLRYGRA